MFTINKPEMGMEMRIDFYRVPHPDNESRFDTVCRITYYDDLPPFIGVAKLHPNDSPDKVIGKKVALKNALIHSREHRGPFKGEIIIHWRYEKGRRNVIWKAFWAWVESWKGDSKPIVDHQARATQAVTDG